MSFLLCGWVVLYPVFYNLMGDQTLKRYGNEAKASVITSYCCEMTIYLVKNILFNVYSIDVWGSGM